MSEDTGVAYFQFDTNAEQVVARISSAMQAVTAEVAKVTAKTGIQTGFNTSGMVQSILNVNEGLNSLVGNLEAGRISSAKFVQEFRNQAVAGMRDVERELATQVARQPQAWLNQADLGKISRTQFKAYADGLVQQAEEMTRTMPQRLRGVKNFAGDLEAQLMSTAFDQRGRSRMLSAEGLSAMDAARLNAFYESLAVKAARGSMTTADLRRYPGLSSEMGPGGSLHQTFVAPSNRPALANLRELEAQYKAAEKAAYAEVAAQERADAAAQRRANREGVDEARRVRYLESSAKSEDAATEQAARNENRRRDTAAAALQAEANAQNKRRDEAIKTAQVEATAIDQRRNYLQVATQGTIFGNTGYGRVGDNLYEVNTKAEQATRIGALGDELANRAKLSQALIAEERYLRAQTVEMEKQAALTAKIGGSYGDSFAAGFLGRGFRPGEVKPTIGEGIKNEFATLGTVARYSGVYAVLGAVTHAISDTKKEVLDFTDSLTDLKVALNVQSVDTGLVSQLQQIAILSGSNTGAALDAAARGIRAFGDQAQQSGGSVADAGTDIAKASTEIALIANKDLRDATGDVVAIASAFHLAASQANQVVDAISAAKDFGGDPANISQGLANFATTASAAGFTLGEAANALSLVIARTDQSGGAAATRLSKITSILAGTTGRNVIAELNSAGLRDNQGNKINADATVKEQLRQIAEAYQKAGPQLQGQVRSALAGTANLRELIPLLEPGAFDRIIGKATDQSGRGAAEFRRRTTDFVGLMKKFKGDVSAIQVNLFQAGAFDGIGLAMKGLEPAVHVLARLLDVFNQLTSKIPYLQTLLGILLDLKVALLGLRVVGVVGSASLLENFAPRAATAGSATAAGARSALSSPTLIASPGAAGASVAATDASTAAALENASAQHAAAVAAAEAAVASATNQVALTEESYAAGISSDADLAKADAALVAARADLAKAEAAATAAVADELGGSRLAGLAGTLGRLGPALVTMAAIAGAYIAFKGFDNLRAVDSTTQNNAQAVIGGDLTTSAGVDEVVKTLRANREELKKSQQGSFSGLISKSERDKAISDTYAQENYYKSLSKRIDAEDKYSKSLQQTSVFGEDAAASTQAVADAMQKLKDSGVDAQGQLAGLTAAILKKPNPKTGNVPLPSDNPDAFTAGIVGTFLKDIPDAWRVRDKNGNLVLGPDGKPKNQDLAFRRVFGLTDTWAREKALFDPNYSPTDLADFLSKSAPQMQAAALKKFKELNIAPGIEPNDAQMQEIYQAILDASGLSKLGKDYKKLDKQLRSLVLNKVKNDFDVATRAATEGSLDPKTALDQANTLSTALDQSLSLIPKSDINARRKAGQDTINSIKVLQARAAQDPSATPESLQSLANMLNAVQVKVSDEFLADSKAMREALQLRAKGAARIASIGQQYFNQDVANAVENNNLDGLINIFNNANQKMIDAAVHVYQMALAADQAELLAAQRTGAILSSLGIQGVGSTAGEAYTQWMASQNGKIATDQNYVDRVQQGKSMSSAPPKGGSYQVGPSGAASGSGKTAAQIAALRRAAGVAPDDAIGQALADIQSAQADMAAAGNDQAAYYSALKQLHAAQFAYAQAVAGRDAARSGANAARDGGAVAQARAQLTQAAGTLKVATRGTAAYWQALGSYYQAQQGLSDALREAYYDKVRLGSDLTNPVTQAQIALRDAQAKLNEDRRAGRSGLLTKDQLAVRDAQNNLESTAFSQNLQDMQTREQLGQITHQAYMDYLSHEHDRLSAIKDKTYQQYQELQQIDQALKAASDQMQGQFNLGDIKIPTPYEVRRAVTVGGLGAYSASQTTSIVNVQVDGADTGQILTVLSRFLGPLSTQRSTVSSRKV